MPRLRGPILSPPGLAYAPFGKQSVPNPRLKDVVEWMRKFAHQGKAAVRPLVEDICKDVAQGDYASESLAIYHWVCKNIRYMRDVHDVEYLQQPSELLKTRAGDCDDISTLLAAMLMACGNQAAFTLMCFGPAPIPSHVFCSVVTPSGPVPLDPVANRQTASMFRQSTHKLVVPV